MGVGLRRGEMGLLLRFVLAVYVSCAPIIDIPGQGKVEGGSSGLCEYFLGIPYATQPTGVNRWREPIPHPGWSNTLNASVFGPICPQVLPAWRTLVSTKMDEACLNVNIFRPIGASNMPVLVWIHGGDFIQGGANDLETFGCDWVEQTRSGLVVTIQYRLGVLGGLGGSELRGLSREGTSGAWGLQDQIRALEWISQYIGTFGGDSSRVTIAGESAGAASVSNILIAPSARGLFHRAVMQSGAFAPWAAKNETNSQAQYAEFVEATGCVGYSNDNETLACLRGVNSTQAVKLAYWMETFADTWTSSQWSPTTDPQVLPISPYDAILSLQLDFIADVPIIAGVNQEEGSLFATENQFTDSNWLSTELSPGGLFTWLTNNFPDNAVALNQTYGRVSEVTKWAWDRQSWGIAQQIVGDLGFTCPTNRALRVLSAARESNSSTFLTRRESPAFAYVFLAWVDEYPQYGACHGCEVRYVFHSELLKNNTQLALADTITTFWANFLSNGSPGGEWRPYGLNDPFHISLNVQDHRRYLSGVRKRGRLRGDACKLWDRIQGFPESKLLGNNTVAPSGSSQDDDELDEGIIAIVVGSVVLVVICAVAGTCYRYRKSISCCGYGFYGAQRLREDSVMSVEMGGSVAENELPSESIDPNYLSAREPPHAAEAKVKSARPKEGIASPQAQGVPAAGSTNPTVQQVKEENQAETSGDTRTRTSQVQGLQQIKIV
ncbi:hypothetical protein AAMO2058_001707800 [Amorphochlora amoebiformis]